LQGGRRDHGLFPVVRADVGDAGDGVTIILISSHPIPSHLIVMRVTQAEYQEGGKGVLAKKCP
jgi:hypothetical protein